MEGHPPLRRNRDFQVLWAGQVVSTLGSRISVVAFPLLVLAVTDSAAKAGLTVFVETLPLMLLMLPAGAFADRHDRKRIMVIADAARTLGMASIAAALVGDALTFPHILGVAALEGVGYAFFSVAERASLRQIVPPPQLPTALAQNQAREYGALLVGQPLGGLLFGLGRAVPFAADAFSYALSVGSLFLIRSNLQEERTEPRRPMLAEIREGVAFLFRNPFLRTTSLLVTGSDLVVNSLYLGVIVLAESEGASAGLIGIMLAFMGVGGLLGAAIAPRLARGLSPRRVVLLTLWLQATLVPLIALAAPYPLVIGLLFGSMFLFHPTWNAVISSYRIRLTPDRLQGRVQSVASLLSLGAVPLGALAVGVSMELIGTVETVLGIAVLMAAVAVAGTVSGAIRTPPAL